MNSEKKVNGPVTGVVLSLEKKLLYMNKFLTYLSAFFCLIIALIVVIDVFLRFFFNNPLTGVIELQTYMLVVLCFMSLSYTMLVEGHVRVDILSNHLPKKVKLFSENVYQLVGACFFVSISWQYVIRMKESLAISEVSDTLFIPLWPLYLVTILGCAMMALVLIIKFAVNHIKLRQVSLSALPITGLSVFIAIGMMVLPWLLKSLSIELGQTTFGFLAIAMLMFLLFVGVPVALCMGFVGVWGIWYMTDLNVALMTIRMSVFDSVADYFFAVVPFFVMMGFFCLKAGISKHIYETSNKWFGQIPGGLAIGTIFGCGGFAAICGDSLSTAATMGSVSLPEMKRYNYDDSLATASVAVGGTLGILIPPSLGFIIYGIITEESVGKLFMAGVLPGLLLTSLFAFSIWVRCLLKPSLGPKGPKTTFSEKILSLKSIWPILALFGLVIGGIYKGFFTTSEAGGVGAVGALLIAVTYREFSWRQFLDALIATAEITAMVATILFCVKILGYFITLTEIPMQLAGYLAGLDVSRWVFLLLILILYLVLGMMMNILAMIMITLPIFYPTILALGFDPIWFGVIMVIMMEMGQITPPVGINVFVIASVADNVPMGQIFKGIVPFVFVMVLVIIILAIFPQIVLYLPNAMDVLPSIDI